MARPTSRRRQRKPRGQGHERRTEILTAARKLFIAEGYETVTTRRLAECVGLSQTGLYVYFRTKDEILDALSRETFETLATRLKEVTGKVGVGPDLLASMGRAYVDFGLKHAEAYQLAFMIPHSHKDGRKKKLSAANEQAPGLNAFLFFHEQVVRLHQAGLLRVDDTLIASQTAWCALHGLVSLLIAKPEFPWSDRRRLVEALLDGLSWGLSRGLQVRPR